MRATRTCTNRVSPAPFSGVRSLVLALVAASGSVAACDSAQFADGVPPQVTVAAVAKDTQVLCSSFFSVLYSGVTKTPIYSAEHLTRASVTASRQQLRRNSFHADSRIEDGPQLSDYAHSGFDRGHMSPNGDMPDERSQHESFALSNMVPQNANNNRHLWSAIENVTRHMVDQASDIYVVTGPGFLGNVTRIGNVAVPTYLWKAVYLPRVGRHGIAAAWFTANAPGKAYDVITIAELTKRVGVDPFPSLSDTVKHAGARFGIPEEYHHNEDE